MNAPPHRTPAAQTLVDDGRRLMNQRDFKRVVALTAQTPPGAENDLDILGLRYAAQAEIGDLKGAIETLRRIVDLRPDALGPVNDLALFLFMTGQREEADHFARHAIRLAPVDAQAHNMMGMLLSDGNDLRSGEWHYRRAIELAGAQGKLLANLALNLSQQGRAEEAEPVFAEAARLEPNNPATLVNWARLYESRGDVKRAHELLDRAAPLAQSAGGDISLARATVLSREKRHEEAVAVLSAGRGGERETQLMPIKQLERGRLYDRLGRHQEAWSDFAEAKARFAATGDFKYDKETIDRMFMRHRHFFSRNHMGLLPRATRRAGPQPIFILGFPRSGTTMIEQVLSSHSQVRAGDELPFVAEIVRLAPRIVSSPFEYPEALSELWMADRTFAISAFRDYYLARAEQAGLLQGGHNFFTDKLPLNETYLPLIHLMFPEAKFVHLIRHPLDVGVSVMSNFLTHGFNCGFALETFAQHYVAVHNLVTHLRHQHDYPYLPVRYETFVSNQREETQRLLDFLGLPFEEACMDFHQNTRQARTASYAQVTEKLYTRSVTRYQRYVAYMQPAVPILAPALKGLGYEV